MRFLWGLDPDTPDGVKGRMPRLQLEWQLLCDALSDGRSFLAGSDPRPLLFRSRVSLVSINSILNQQANS